MPSSSARYTATTVSVRIGATRIQRTSCAPPLVSIPPSGCAGQIRSSTTSTTISPQYHGLRTARCHPSPMSLSTPPTSALPIASAIALASITTVAMTSATNTPATASPIRRRWRCCSRRAFDRLGASPSGALKAPTPWCSSGRRERRGSDAFVHRESTVAVGALDAGHLREAEATGYGDRRGVVRLDLQLETRRAERPACPCHEQGGGPRRVAVTTGSGGEPVADLGSVRADLVDVAPADDRTVDLDRERELHAVAPRTGHAADVPGRRRVRHGRRDAVAALQLFVLPDGGEGRHVVECPGAQRHDVVGELEVIGECDSGHRWRCMTTTSSHCLNFRPTSRSTPTLSKPHASWRAMLASCP